MNKNVQALATLMRRRESEVNAAWNQAKRHCAADGDKGNYVRAFGMVMQMLKFKQVSDRMLPKQVGDAFWFMGSPATLTSVGEGITFQLTLSGRVFELPLINLIFCTSHVSSPRNSSRRSAETR